MLKLGTLDHPVYVDPEKVVAVQAADANTTLVHVPGGALIVPQPLSEVAVALGCEQPATPES